jgi:hypothetical protein
MADKVNLVLDDEVKEEFARLVPASERNRFANEALRARLNLLKRLRAVEQLESLRRREPSVTSVEVVQALGAARLGFSEVSRTADPKELLARLRTRERVELTEPIAAAVAAEREGRPS